MEYTRTELDRDVRNVRYLILYHLRDRWEQSNDTECDTECLDEQTLSRHIDSPTAIPEKNDVETSSAANA